MGQISADSWKRRSFLAATLGVAAGSAFADQHVSGPLVKSQRAAVAAESDPAARAASQVLADGGNAADAAAAACIASCIVEPQLVDLGGYVAAAVVLDAKSGKTWSIDADSAAPRAASPSMFRVLPKPPGKRGLNENEYGCSVQNNANVDGALAVGVPATLAGIGTIQERFGRLKWSQVVAPSQALLADGFPVSPELAKAVEERTDVLRGMPAAAAQFIPEGKPLRKGQIWHRPDMEWTLKRLSSAGWRDLYQGEIARRIVDQVRSMGGILTREDLARYQVHCTPAVEIACGDSRLFSAALPNGGLTCLSALLMLQGLPPAAYDDPLRWHFLAEVLKIAWRDRLSFFGDPAKIDLDWQRFIHPEYIDEKIARLKKKPRSVDLTPGPGLQPSPGTVPTSAADADGNIVSITISHGAYFGSCVTVPGTGITLGHGMCRFDPHPGLPNSIAPGKRPLNNVCPLILRQPARDAGFGMRGGRRIVSVVTSLGQLLLQGQPPEAVVRSARLHTDGFEPIEVTDSLPAAIRSGLEKMGHHLKVSATVGGSCNIAERRANGEMSAATSRIATGIE